MPSATILAFQTLLHASERNPLIQPLTLVYPKKDLFRELDKILKQRSPIRSEMVIDLGLLAVFTNHVTRPF